jgi:hypothetical protein
MGGWLSREMGGKTEMGGEWSREMGGKVRDMGA